MKQKITQTILGGIIALIAMFTFVPAFATVQAQNPSSNPACTTNCTQSGLSAISPAFPARTERTVEQISRLIINWALYLSAIIAVIFIIIGGFKYITSQGNATKAGEGRQTLINALIGLTMIVLSYIIVQIVYNFLIS